MSDLNNDSEMSAWIEKVGLTRKGPSEEIKATDLSKVQRLDTDMGYLFFKATGEISKFEGRLTHHLSSHYAERIVDVVKVHPTNPWFLMKELKGKPLRQIKDKKIWKQCLQEYAELQVKEVQRVETLLEMGVPDRRLPVLKNEIQKNLFDMCNTGLDQAETAQVMGLQAGILRMCGTIFDRSW
ncbi:hypothetical protein ACQCT5_04345 [Sutcliffiella halmapala]